MRADRKTSVREWARLAGIADSTLPACDLWQAAVDRLLEKGCVKKATQVYLEHCQVFEDWQTHGKTEEEREVGYLGVGQHSLRAASGRRSLVAAATRPYHRPPTPYLRRVRVGEVIGTSAKQLTASMNNLAAANHGRKAVETWKRNLARKAAALLLT